MRTKRGGYVSWSNELFEKGSHTRLQTKTKKKKIYTNKTTYPVKKKFESKVSVKKERDRRKISDKGTE